MKYIDPTDKIPQAMKDKNTHSKTKANKFANNGKVDEPVKVKPDYEVTPFVGRRSNSLEQYQDEL